MRRKQTPDQDAVARLRLARTEGVGPITYRRLLRRYLSAEAALDAVPRLARAGGRIVLSLGHRNGKCQRANNKEGFFHHAHHLIRQVN